MKKETRDGKDIKILDAIKSHYLSGTLTTHDLREFIKLCERRGYPPTELLKLLEKARTFYELEFFAKTYIQDKERGILNV